ncbi:DNA-binding domain-containing protein, AraC-type [Burkholderia sp. Ch1-1]|uniref:DNA-binding domain-containing protein, AraC-type n=1 Tax=Paraburkholderia dioscoreae TaxID=2604047 RepID=A0A5Q4ZDH5_9BURK|nr:MULTISPECIES: AraC family transcriptional regulator [Paraburkholderia]EIF34487.1 DNA-binding domain-containing protein, AraC-type [Burkholderia sp. Ch1-1]MDR8395351.1 AraC family transcriptional regulator [Paraburkholderia sp. USG1]VVD33429.1 DNA-binding domain-containing protein, AraC-type [Paraburkholderia dioscoreae]
MSSKIEDDPLSDFLRLLGAQPVVAGGFSAGGTWAIRFPQPKKIKFFALVKGSCWLSVDAQTGPVAVGEGDVFLLTGERSFVLASDPDAAPVDAATLFSGNAARSATIGDGNGCTQIGGHVRLAPSNDTLLVDALPSLIHIRADCEQAAVLQWLLARLVKEFASGLPGSGLASTYLAQLMFVEMLRVHLDSGAEIPNGWLRAIGDKRLAPALRLMHADPGRAWRLDELASAAAMSRTSFCVHFRSVAGMAPLTWLTQWRMRMARQALIDEKIPIAVLAARLGYSSESAFSSAFKRMSSVSPSEYRRTGWAA